MKPLNKEIKNVLSKLIKEIELYENYCEIDEAYSYLFGTTNYDLLLNETPKLPTYPYYNLKAFSIYEEWEDTKIGETLAFKGRKPIPCPLDKDMTLLECLKYLDFQIREKNENRINWKKSLLVSSFDCTN